MLPNEREIEQALQYMIRQRQRAICDAEMQAISQGVCISACGVPPLSAFAETAAKEVLQCSKPALTTLANMLCALYRQRVAASV